MAIQKGHNATNDDPKDDPKELPDGVKAGVKAGVKELSEIQKIIVSEIQLFPSITTRELAQKIDVKFRTLQRYISQLQSLGVLVRKGGRKDGYWVITGKSL